MFLEEIIFHGNVFLLSLRRSFPGMVWIKSYRIFLMKSISYWSSKYSSHFLSERTGVLNVSQMQVLVQMQVPKCLRS